MFMASNIHWLWHQTFEMHAVARIRGGLFDGVLVDGMTIAIKLEPEILVHNVDCILEAGALRWLFSGLGDCSMDRQDYGRN
jgi:hypothetical protein